MKRHVLIAAGFLVLGLGLKGQCNFTLSLSSTPTTCWGDSDGSVSVQVNGGTGPFTYQWSTTPPSGSATVTNLPAGYYNVSVTDGSNCTISDGVALLQPSKLSADVGFDTAVCQWEPVILRSVVLGGTPPYRYAWSCNQTDCKISDTTHYNPVISVGSPVNYYFYSEDSHGCLTTVDSVVVTVNILPVVDAGNDKFTYLTDEVTLEATASSSGGTYEWFPTTALTHPDSNVTDAEPEYTTEYFVYYTDEMGCKDTSSVIVEVERNVTVATGFTPNGDGVNDFWVIKNLVLYPNVKTYVFNRTGQEVYSAVDNTQYWDGTYKGKDLPAGTYFYILDLDGQAPLMKGSFTLIR